MKNSDLHIAKGLRLPASTATQKLAWLGTTGSGKTYGASKLAEEFWKVLAQFVVLDPVGVWYGLRLSKDGKKPSEIDIPVFGGLHGDIPLESTAGELMANLIVDKGLSCVLDVSQFESDTEKARFATDFANKFFFRKKASPSAVHLFLEECQEFVPQNPQRGEERMLHAFVRMQKLGRNFGIGSSYISQRPQEVNKKALNMAQTLFVFRNTGSHERNAIEKWIEDKSLDESIANDLPKIETGHCHVWSPEFLKISEMVHISEKETFNASATPEVGTAAKARQLAPIDLKKVQSEMAATIEKAKSEDPKLLRKRVADLEIQLREKISQKPVDASAYTQNEKVDRMIENAVRIAEKKKDAEFMAERDEFLMHINTMFKVIETVGRTVKDIKLPDIKKRSILAKEYRDMVLPSTRGSFSPSAPTTDAQPLNLARHIDFPRNEETSKEMGSGERNVLIAIAQQPDGMTREHITVQTGHKRSTRDAYIQRLKAKGYVDVGDRIRATEAGIAALGEYETLPTGDELIAYHLNKLPEGEARIFRILCDSRTVMDRDLISAKVEEQTGKPIQRSTRDAYIQRLSARQLVVYEGRGMVKANDKLFV